MLQESGMSTNSSSASSSSLYEDVSDAAGLFAIRVEVLLHLRIWKLFQSLKVVGLPYPSIGVGRIKVRLEFGLTAKNS